MQLVIEKRERMQLLKTCYNNMEHRGIYVMEKLLQQRFWWPEIKENVTWYIKSYHLYQIRQKYILEQPSVVTHILSIFQVLYTDIVHINLPSNDCKYIVHERCGLLS